LRESKPACVDEARERPYDYARAALPSNLDGAVVRFMIENEYLSARRKRVEQTRQIALFVARKDDGGNLLRVRGGRYGAALRANSCSSRMRSSRSSAAPTKSR
jgi:hypothetical protein